METKSVESKDQKIKALFAKNKLTIIDKKNKTLNEYNIDESYWSTILDAELEITDDSVKATTPESVYTWQIKKTQSGFNFCIIT